MTASRVPGERLVYRVTSETQAGETYRVDLEENGFRGGCSCMHFLMRLMPAYRADRQFRSCKHIKHAMMIFGWHMLQEIRREARAAHGTSRRDIGPA